MVVPESPGVRSAGRVSLTRSRRGIGYTPPFRDRLSSNVAHTVIAIVADCDDTLAPDTTAQLLKQFGIDPKEFYRGPVGQLVDEGFDPAVAYLNQMLADCHAGGPLAGLPLAAI